MTLAVGDDAPDFDLPQALDAGDNIKLSESEFSAMITYK